MLYDTVNCLLFCNRSTFRGKFFYTFISNKERILIVPNVILTNSECAFFVAPDDADVNLALDKPASQISTYSTAAASLAVDGLQGTTSCTYGHVHPWLSVDLGAEYDVGHVTVTNDINAGYGIIVNIINLKLY